MRCIRVVVSGPGFGHAEASSRMEHSRLSRADRIPLRRCTLLYLARQENYPRYRADALVDSPSTLRGLFLCLVAGPDADVPARLDTNRHILVWFVFRVALRTARTN